MKYKKRIALFGIFGVLNIGNECTLQAMAHNTRTRLPEAEVYTISYDPEDTHKRHELAAIPVSHRYSGAEAQSATRKGRLARLAHAVCVGAPREILDFVAAYQVLRDTDLLAMTGTGMLTDVMTSAYGYPYQIWKWTLAAKLAGCKVRFVGIGVGPVYAKLSRWFIKSALTSADYRSYRDGWSKTRLEGLGFNTDRDAVFPDLAFSLPPSVLPPSVTQVSGRRVVGLGVMEYFDPRAAPQQCQEEAYEAYLDKISRFARWLVDRGYAIRILHGDVKHDRNVRRDLQVRLESRGVTYASAGIVDDDILSVDDLLAQLALTDVVVSQRFHNQVLALMLHKPVISISYDPKSDALLEGIGLGRFCQPIEDLNVERLIEQFIDLERMAPSWQAQARQKTDEYRQLLDEQYRLVLDTL